MRELVGPTAKNVLSEGIELSLSTCRGTRIVNRRPLVEDDLSTQERNAASYERKHLGLERRSLSSMYNCIGMVIASRRTRANIADVRRILAEDNYRRIAQSEAVTGDLVVYCLNDEPQHIGMIHDVPINNRVGIRVLSKWGPGPEYVHPIAAVPDYFGEPTEFWTHRRVL